jgi:protein phosphatase
MRWGASTDAGMVRAQNEDSYSAENGIFVVADGMGGHNAGEVASALAVTTVKVGARTGLKDASEFRELVQQANTAIYTASLDDSAQRGMGTTLAAATVLRGETPVMMVANVGDSRVYLHRDGRLTRISVDHSYVQELVNEGVLTAEEARVHPRRNIVTRALGIDRHVAVDVFLQEVRTGDRLLLCSDGLVDEVSDAQIQALVTRHSDPQELAEVLVMVANSNGGHDNTTVIVVDILDDISEPVDRPEPDHTSPLEQLADATRRRWRRIPVGAALFWALVVTVVLSGVTLTGVYARSGWFIGFDENDRVAIYRGRPGGVLWFEPTIDTVTDLAGEVLPEDIMRDVALNRTFSSPGQARTYLDFVEIAIVGTTTTTIPGSATTTTAGG